MDSNDKGTPGDGKVHRKEESNEFDLQEVYDTLREDFRKLNALIDFYDTNPKRLANLMNIRYKVSTSIFTCVALMNNPKFKIRTDTGKKKDLARLIERTLLKDSSEASKAVDEVRQELEKEKSEPVVGTTSEGAIPPSEDKTAEDQSTNDGKASQ